MLKRNPSLTEQAKAIIKQRILSNEFEAGRIPSEMELATELGVSRTTIRDALSRLDLEGVIYRKQGAGTFVNEARLQLKTRLEEIWDYSAMLQAHGYTPSTRIVEVAEQVIEAKTAVDLNLSTTEKILTVKKLFLADGQPVIFTINNIPARLILRQFDEAVFHQPIFKFLASHCQQHLTYYLSEIAPLIAPTWLVDALHLSQSHRAIISFDEIGYNQDNEPILKAQSFFKDDLLRFRLIRRES
jgi:GntR family transcriptional regulator